ncbi:granzyme G-like [Cebidichthys violaceus]|uniref:granzyme G-like n=1 Tax=Cebidichthys violaceus TaxID=271503 RepID=UPI0035CA10E6
MFIHCELLVLILGLTLDGRVHSGEIIGGCEAVPHSRPYMALLKAVKADGEINHCGGFLLSEDFVMTAAHCQAKSYTVFLGLHNYHKRDEVQMFDVKQSYPHKDFPKKKNDIMLLKLSSKATFTRNVKPITLADKNDVSPKSCLVSGWGRTERNNNKSLSLKLKEVNITLSDNAIYAVDNMYYSEGPMGPGQGDSGSPLVCEGGKAYGVVSFYKKKDLNYYAKIPDCTSWIKQTLMHGDD